MKSFLCFTFGLALMLSAMRDSQAIDIAGHNLPSEWRLKEDKLILNGAGVREYSFLKIHVYVAALYLPARETNAGAVLSATSPRVIHMKMLRDVSREDAVSAWRHYLNQNCQSPCVLDSHSLTRFASLVPETKVNDTQTYVFAEGRVEIIRNEIKLGEVANAAFANVLLATWVGDVPTTVSLKRALLGAAR